MNFFCIVKFINNNKDFVHSVIKRFEDGMNYIPFIGKYVNLIYHQKHSTLSFSTSMNDPIFEGLRTYADDDVFINFSGIPIVSDKNPKSILDTILKTSINSCYYNTEGTYNIAGVLPTGEVFAFSDWSGRYPVFYAKTNDVIAFSNRQSLLSHIVFHQIKINLETASFLASHGNIWLDDGIYQGVKLLEPCTFGKIHKTNFLQISDFSWQIYNLFDKSEKITPEHFDYASECMNKKFSKIREMKIPEMNLWLSAGKDSRIVLAYAIKNNLNFTALTSGYEESPEVQCASDMCSILHVPHTKKLTLKDNTPNNRNYIDELAYHAGRHDSSLAPTAGHNKPITGNTNKAIIGGFGGELYRKGENPFHRTHKFETIEDVMKHWENYHVKRDVLNVMNTQILNAHKIKLANWAREQYEKNIPLKALPELFWIKYRYPYHHGIAMNGYGFDTRLDPLYQKEIINIHLQDEYENGMYGRTNFELLVRANKFLVEFPYVNDTWHPQLLPKIQEYSNTREQINMNFQKYQNKMYQDKILRPQTWNLLQNCRQELKTLFATNSELYEIVDRNKIERLLERETINVMSEINQFLSIISLQLTLTGQIRRSKDVNVEHRKSKITTNTFALLPSS